MPLYEHGYFSGLPALETPRLTLRRMTLRDAQDVFAYSRDEQVARHVLWEAQRSIGDARAYLRYMIRQYRHNQPASWGIVLRETGRLIGTIGFMSYSEDHASAEVGYSLSRDYWNRGLMSEALEACLRYAFEEMGLHRVEAQFELDNPASGRVMEKCGLQKEGILRGRLYNKGRYVDVCLYAMLEEDWFRRHPRPARSPYPPVRP
jgi:ribosomal-protein-alanine N-acetyltransferase